MVSFYILLISVSSGLIAFSSATDLYFTWKGDINLIENADKAEANASSEALSFALHNPLVRPRSLVGAVVVANGIRTHKLLIGDGNSNSGLIFIGYKEVQREQRYKGYKEGSVWKIKALIIRNHHDSHLNLIPDPSGISIYSTVENDEIQQTRSPLLTSVDYSEQKIANVAFYNWSHSHDVHTDWVKHRELIVLSAPKDNQQEQDQQDAQKGVGWNPCQRSFYWVSGRSVYSAKIGEKTVGVAEKIFTVPKAHFIQRIHYNFETGFIFVAVTNTNQRTNAKCSIYKLKMESSMAANDGVESTKDGVESTKDGVESTKEFSILLENAESCFPLSMASDESFLYFVNAANFSIERLSFKNKEDLIQLFGFEYKSSTFIKIASLWADKTGLKESSVEKMPFSCKNAHFEGTTPKPQAKTPKPQSKTPKPQTKTPTPHVTTPESLLKTTVRTHESTTAKPDATKPGTATPQNTSTTPKSVETISTPVDATPKSVETISSPVDATPTPAETRNEFSLSSEIEEKMRKKYILIPICLSGGLLLVIILILIKQCVMKRRPKITLTQSVIPSPEQSKRPKTIKRFTRSKSKDAVKHYIGFAGVQSSSGICSYAPEDGVVLNIEDCCQMQLCDTPCVTSMNREGKSYLKSCQTSEDASGLLDDFC